MAQCLGRSVSVELFQMYLICNVAIIAHNEGQILVQMLGEAELCESWTDVSTEHVCYYKCVCACICSTCLYLYRYVSDDEMLCIKFFIFIFFFILVRESSYLMWALITRNAALFLLLQCSLNYSMFSYFHQKTFFFLLQKYLKILDMFCFTCLILQVLVITLVVTIGFIKV